MSERNCLVCGAPLPPERPMYCSRPCNKIAWLKRHPHRDAEHSRAYKDRNREAVRAKDREYRRRKRAES